MPHATEEAAKGLCGHREGLDKWLAAPTAEEAEYERAVLKHLTT